MVELHHTTDSMEVQKEAARILINEIRRLRSEQARILIAVPGGRNVAALFSYLKTADIDWMSIHFFMVDERMVPLDDPESNYSVLWQHLGKELMAKGLLPEKNLHPFRCEGMTPQQAVDRYSQELKGYAEGFDIVILSAGEDGHVAGLYPEHHSINEGSKFFIHMDDSPKSPSRRMSASRELIQRSQVAITLFSGEGKRDAFERFQAEEDVNNLPVNLIHRVGKAFVITDLSQGQRGEV